MGHFKSIVLLLVAGHVYAADFTEELPLTLIVQHSPIFDGDGYVHMTRYAFIQPDFVKAVLSGQVKETLEVCAGQGFVLQDVLQKQEESHPNIRYTAVEISPEHSKTMNEKWKKYNKRPEKSSNWAGIATTGVIPFLTTNFEKKINKYDLVFAGYALHILPAPDFVKALDGLYRVMKVSGTLYSTQHSTRDGGYDEEYIANVKQGKLLPFFVKGKFYSDVATTKRVFRDFGFEIKEIGLYREIHAKHNGQPNYLSQSNYLGLIAEKNPALRNDEKIKQYYLSLATTVIHGPDANGCNVRITGNGMAGDIWAVNHPKFDHEDEYRSIQAEVLVEKKVSLGNITTRTENNSCIALNALLSLLCKKYPGQDVIATVKDDLNDDTYAFLTKRFGFTPTSSESSTALLAPGQVQLESDTKKILNKVFH